MFEDVKTICEELSGTRSQQKPIRLLFVALNDDCLAEDRPRELKLVSLEWLGNEDSGYVFKNFFACL